VSERCLTAAGTKVAGVRIAVVADIHGNLPALEAVLDDVDALSVDAVLVAGDVVGGPLVAESLELLNSRPEAVHWIGGNAEREAVAAYDGAATSDDLPGRAASWSARALSQGWRSRLASWPTTVTLSGVVFCHGSPRSDDEILTRISPEATYRDALAGVTEALVVGGHTHQQFIRQLGDNLTFANAGSVGLPYEGRLGAFWMLIDDNLPRLRQTAYDQAAAVSQLRASGFPGLEDHLDGSLLNAADPGWVAAFFEHRAGRGEDPGEPVLASRARP